MKTFFVKAICLIWFACILACPLNTRAGAAGEPDAAILRRASKAFTEAAKSTIPSVVFIQVEQRVVREQHPLDYWDPFGFFGTRPRPDERSLRRVGQGSGFIVSEDGYILSNHHIVGEADEITVRLHDGRELSAELVGTDPQSEVAVIKVDAAGLPAARLGSSAALETGEWVMAVGNPFGLSETVTVGIVSAKGRTGMGIADYEDFIQTDAAINPGNSGGPLINLDGEVVGMNTAIYTRTGGYMGIGFAIPIDMVRNIKEQLVRDGRVERGYLGIVIQNMTSELAASFGLDEVRGILISQVAEDSPAGKAGLSDGDIILELNGGPVKEVAPFRNAIASMPPGNEIELLLFRDGKEKKIKTAIGKLPSPEVAVSSKVQDMIETVGIKLEELSEEQLQKRGHAPEHGLVISEVRSGSPAARAGLRPGLAIISVNRQRINNIREFEEAMQPSLKTNSILLQVTDGARSRYIAFTLD